MRPARSTSKAMENSMATTVATTGVVHYLQTGDAVTHGVAYLLLAMSVASWCFLLVKAWMLVRAKRQGPRSLALFWQSATLSEAVLAIRAADTERVFVPLAVAALDVSQTHALGTHALLARVDFAERVTRALR